MKEMIEKISAIQKIRDWSVQENKLMIIFEQEIMLYAKEVIEYHLKEFDYLVYPKLITENNHTYLIIRNGNILQ